MRPNKQTLDALGNSPWMPVDYRINDFGVGIGVTVSDGGVLTYSIQHTFDQVFERIPVSIARVTTVATVTFVEPHNKSVGDSIAIGGTQEANLKGTFDIASVPSDTTLTYTVANTGSTSENAQATPYSVFEHETLSGLSANSDGGYTLPPSAIRLVVSAFTSGNVTANYLFLSK